MITAKKQLIEFLKYVKRTGKTEFTFTILLSEGKAKDYLHRMRVELSRFRRKLKDEGKQIISFKMNTTEWKVVDNGVQVTLEYIQNVPFEMQKELSDIFGVLSTGDDALDDKYVRGLPATPPQRTRPLTIGKLHVETS
jgi:hypothetical protein